jgi:hypothetical protein
VSAPTLARCCNHHPRHWDAPWRVVQSPLGEYPPIHLNGTGGLVQVTEGKTKAARRMLPMVPAFYVALKARKEASGSLEEGWVFPASSREGHLNKDTAKGRHRRGLDRAKRPSKGGRC